MQRIVIKGLIVTLMAEGVTVHGCQAYAADCRGPQKHIEQEGNSTAPAFTSSGIYVSVPATEIPDFLRNLPRK